MLRATAAFALFFGAAVGTSTVASAGTLTMAGTFAPSSFGVVSVPFTGSIDLSTGTLGLNSSWIFNLGGWTGGAGPPEDYRAALSASTIPDDETSKWIAAPPSLGGLAYWSGATSLTFSDTFYLDGVNISTVHLSGGWAVGGDWDYGNVATLSLNGAAVATFDDFSNPLTELLPFNAPASLFNQDANTLSITFRFDPTADPEIASFDFTDDVARLSAVLTASAVLEPSTWALMLLGFAGCGLVGWRASRKTAAASA